ncbi:MAG: ligase, partial [Thermoleophilia bacterium]|nr:ligase [Thermoleophilia bacterium]
MEPGASPVVSWCDLTAPALIVGRSAAPPPVDWQACTRLGLPVHRRASGGGAVLWDADLVALDVVLPPGHELLGADVVAAYRWVGEAVRRALADCNVEADLVDVRRARADTPDQVLEASCFGGLSPWELTADGRKIVGLSQVRRRTGGAFQVGIPMRFDGATLAETLFVDTERLAAALRARVVDLATLRPEVRRGTLVQHLRARLGEALG